MVYLSRLTFGSYRSFGSANTFEPSWPRIDETGRALKGYNVIVGPNNSGKSSLIELVAASMDQPGSSHPGGQKLKATFVKSFSENEVEQTWSPADDNDQPGVLYINSTNSVNFGGTLTTDIVDSSSVDNEPYTSIHSALKSISGQSALELQNYLWRLQELGLNDTFATWIKIRLPDFGSYRITVDQNRKAVFDYKDSYGVKTDINSLSLGTKSVLVVLSYLFYFLQMSGRTSDSLPPSCLLIDEPEKSIHPELQKLLHELLLELSTHMQVIVVTHSPHFINWQSVEGGSTIHRIFRLQDGTSTIRKLDENTLSDIGAKKAFGALRQPLRQSHFEPLSREVLFSSAALITEGHDDAVILRHFVNEKQFYTNYDIFAYGADGADSIKYWAKILLHLGIKVAVLYDGNKANEAAVMRELLGDERLSIVLPTDDIRDKRACKQRQVVGIASDKGVVKEEYVDLLKGILVDYTNAFR